jgi:tetratricopeptide (TPR) repeat protein
MQAIANPPSEVRPMDRVHALFAVLLVMAAALAVYLPTPGNYWIRYDNEAFIRSSPQVQALAGEDKIEALATIFTSTHYSLYQPLFTLSVAIDHALFGWDLGAFHAHSVLLHLAVVALLVLLLFRLTGSWPASIAATLLVAVHPALVETVRWAICRNSLVAAVWLLIGAHLYQRHLERPGPAALWSSQAALGLSLLGKLSPAIFLIPFLLDLWRKRRIDRRALLEKLPLFALTALLTAVNYRATVAHVGENPLRRPWSEVLGYLPESIALMTANALAPAHLAILYPPAAMQEFLGWRWIAMLVAAAAAVGGGFWAWRRGHRGVLLGLAGWLVLLAPNVAAGRFRASIASDRYIYLPILFLAAALAAALSPAFRARAAAALSAPAGEGPGALRTAVRWIAGAAALAIAVTLGLAAHAQARTWEDERQIWQQVNDVAPHYMAYYSLGNLALQEEKWPEAAEHFSRALELARLDPYVKNDPIYSSAYIQSSRRAASELEKQPATEQSQEERAALLERAGEVAKEAAAALPADAEAQFQLGRTEYKQKKYREAVAALDAAIAVDPNHYQAWGYKAMSQYFLGEKETAIASFRKSLAIRPYWMTYSNLGKVYTAEGKFAEAAEVHWSWLMLEPKSDEAHNRFLQTVTEILRRGAAPAAVALLEPYLARFPDSAPAKTLLEQAQLPR